MAHRRIGQVLVDMGFITDEQQELLVDEQHQHPGQLLGKVAIDMGLITDDQLHLIRHGTKSRGVVTGMRTTGASRDDHREVVLDVMVRKPGGGQFPAHETTLIPASSLAKVSPGSIIDAYYRSGDESAVAVCVAPT